MISMKEPPPPPPPLSRRRNPTAVATKLNLLCSFNGAFRPMPPSGALRYFGGETRIVSVDRNFALSNLRSKIADLSPAIASFVVKYQLLVISGSASSAAAAPLLLLDSDDDVRRMVDAFEKLESCDKSARLKLFVCSINTANGVGSGHRARSEAQNRVENEKHEPLRKMVLRQQLLAKQSGSGLGRGPGELGETKKCEGYEPLLIDLDTDCDNVARFSMARCNVLNPRDGNVRVDQGLGKVVCNGVGANDQLVLAMQGLKPVSCSGVKPGCNVSDVKNGMDGIGNVNSEKNSSLVKNGWSCDSMVDTGNRVCGGLDSSLRNHRFGGSDGRHQRCIPVVCVSNHRSNIAEMGNHRTVRLDGRLSTRKCIGHRPHMSIRKQGQSVRVYYPNSWRQYGSFSEYSSAERVKVLNSSSIKDRSLSGVQHGDQKQSEENGPGLLQHVNVNRGEYCSGYYGEFTPVGDQSHLNCDVTENLFPSVRTMDTKENLVSLSGFGKCEGQYQSPYGSVHGLISKCEPIHCDPDKETCLTDIVNGLKSYGASGSKIGSNNIQDSNYGVTCSVNISLRNLSLSKEVEGPQLSVHAGCVMTSDALLKPQSELTDVMDEGQFISGPQVKESNGVASEHSFQNSDKIDTGSEHVDEDIEESSPSLSFTEEANHGEGFNCSKVIGGTSNYLASFYTHIATRDMQTIKNSDLEFIKELGSGTYGTVYHGKWKGSNVAIKKIKPSCFANGVLEDRLLADFWKEAHILGQLHHPNIVAFYGVVTDGPVTDLATVTEYMVNGSLQQVLRRKDRTIDRRKRLILAMDASFGMEYLHEKNIVHFDLKSHNFLVNMKDPHRPVCKIGDLGLSKIKQRTLVSGGVRGTVPWMAPELLNSNSKNNLVTEKVDVYSFGIVMWELLTGEEPYANLRSEDIIAGIIKGNLRPEIPSWCDPTWRSLMERCWSSDPKSRPPFSEISKELRAMSAGMNIN